MENTFQDDTLLARWLSGELSEAERQALEQHPDYAHYRAIVDAADRLALPDAGVSALWERLKPALQPRKPARSKPVATLRWLWWSVGAAATVLLGFFLWTLSTINKPLPQMAATAIGEQKTVTLPDGSTVRLNAVSSIEVLPWASAKTRTVRLLGEAFFDVKKGMAPFVVETALGSVTVLGTSFTVKHRGGVFEVACYNGLVQATTIDGHQQALRAGKKAAAKNGTWFPFDDVTDSWPGWMQGESRFANAPLYEVFAELQRQYNIKISAAGLSGRIYSGAFVHGDLALALRMVCDPMELKYELDDKTVRIQPR